MALLGAVTVSAQTAEEMQASATRMARIAELQLPKTTGLAQVDALQEQTARIAEETLRISLTLGKWKADADKGEIGVSILPEAIALSKAIAGQTKAQTEATQLLPKAAEELKTVKNPMKLKGAKNSIDYSKTTLEIVGEEPPYQTRTVAEIIRTLKGE